MRDVTQPDPSDAAERVQRFLGWVMWCTLIGTLLAIAVAVTNLALGWSGWWVSLMLVIGTACGARALYVLRRVRRRLVASAPFLQASAPPVDARRWWSRWRNRWLLVMMAIGLVFVGGSLLIGWAAGNTAEGGFVAAAFIVACGLAMPPVYLLFRRYLRPR